MNLLRNFVIGMTVAAGGCVGSVHPFVEDRSAIFDAGLLGTWTDSSAAERAVVTTASPGRYAIEYTDGGGKVMLLTGVLGRTGAHYVLDVQPTSEALGAYKDVVVRMHIPVILDATSGLAHLALLELDSLDAYLQRNPRAVAHVRTRDGLTLTAGSPALARFLAAYLRRKGVLGEPSSWTRRSP